jgi:hypothetical protein
MSSLFRRMSRIMHVGIVHQLAVSFDTLIVDVEKARYSTVAMSLVRCNDLILAVCRNDKMYLETKIGSLVHGQLDFNSRAHFSARFTLYESVHGSFQPKNLKVQLKDGRDNVICTGIIDIAQHAGCEELSVQVQFDGGEDALCFLTLSCLCTEGDALSPEHNKRDRGLSLDSVASIAIPISPEEIKLREQKDLHEKLVKLNSSPLPPSIAVASGGFTCRVCKNTWSGSKTCILCESYVGETKTSSTSQSKRRRSNNQNQRRQTQRQASQKRQLQKEATPPIISSQRRALLKRSMNQQLVSSNVETKTSNTTLSTTTSSSTSSTSSLPTGWSTAIDPSTKKTYYYNRKKNLTSWIIPTTSMEEEATSAKVIASTKLMKTTPKKDSATLQNSSTLTQSPSSLTPTTTRKNAAANTPPVVSNEWKSAKDPKTGRRYMYNSKGETKWETKTNNASTNNRDSNPTKDSNLKYIKYERMLKAGVPLPAVQGKMRQEGMSESDIATVSGGSGGSSGSSGSGASNVNKKPNPKHVKYLRMLKAGVPRPAVEGKMRQEGMSESDIAAVSGGGGGGGGCGGRDGGGASNVNKKPNPKHVKYLRMLKAGVPRPAVEGKMRQDGMSESDIAAVSGGSSDVGGGSGEIVRTSPGIRFSRLAEPGTMKKLEKYGKMKKAKIPSPAIMRTMLNDGIDKKLAEAFLGIDNAGTDSSGNSNGSGSNIRKKNKSNGMMKLHWKKVDEQHLSENSIWSTSSHKIDHSTMDEKEKNSLKSIFSKTVSRKNVNNKAKKSNEQQKKKKIIDGKRSQNVEICLSKFRCFSSYESVSDALSTMNTTLLRPNIVLLFRSVLPTVDETKKLQYAVEGRTKDANIHKQNLKLLPKAEQFM